MLELLGEGNTVALIGLLGGIALGLAARVGRFCTLGAIEDVLYGSDDRRMRMWAIAIGVAIICTQLAGASGWIDLGQTAYLDRVWNPLGTIIGGLMFGYGMALAGNCGFGMLARLGGGDLRALVIGLVMGVTAYAALSGVLSLPRVMIFPVERATAPTGLAHQFGTATGLSPNGLGVGLGLLCLIFAARQLWRANRLGRLLWSVIAGLAVASGFIGTHWVASTGFEPWQITSHSFTQPIGETIHFAMFSSALAPSFGLGSVLGVVLGGAIGSAIRGEMRWEACEDHRELRRQMLGAGLMGLGAVLAAGCSIGQGLSALSTLSVTAPVVGAAIWLGAWVGLRRLILGAHYVA